MELLFLAILIGLMAGALASGYPVAFALPGSAIISILLAAGCGYLFAGDMNAYFAQGGPSDWLSSGVTNFRGVYWEVERDTLIAIPLFVFMGIMLQRSKIAEDLLVTMAQLFGPIPGGLGISVIFVGALLAATTGILGATVVAMGLISLPAMLRNNYSQPLATGTIAASGTLGQIIPPSIVLIILADQLSSAVDQADTARKALFKESTGSIAMPSEFGVVSTSAGDMFLGALVPGLVLVALYMLYVLVIAILRPHLAPAVPITSKIDGRFLMRAGLILIPPLTLIFVVLGSIITGVATVNQAGAIGAVGAMIMAGYRLREGQPRALVPALLAVVSLVAIFIIIAFLPTNIKNVKTSNDVLGVTLALIAVAGFLVAVVWSGWRAYKIDNTLHGVMIETAKTTSLVFIILLGAAMLTAAFRAFGGEELVRHFLTSLPGGFWAQFIIVMGVIFLLGFFLDFIEIAVVVVPIVAPILLMDPGANVTAVWLGVMIGLNIQTSFLTPPFGFALFYLRGVAPATVKTIEIYKGVVPFILLQLLALFIVGSYPPLVNYLPTRLSLTSENAPPPQNPKLQYCIEEYVFDQYAKRGGQIRSAIGTARSLDISYLPARMKRDLAGSFDKADSVFARIDAIRTAEKAMQAREDKYRPLHREVRALQARARRIDVEANELETQISRLRQAKDAPKKAGLEAELAKYKAERAGILAKVPKEWPAEYKAYTALQKTDTNARRLYRRTADDAYEPVAVVLKTIDDTDEFFKLEPQLRDLAAKIDGADLVASAEAFNAVMSEFAKVEGARDVRSRLSSARRELRRKDPDRNKAREEYGKAIAAFEAQVAWRKRAVAELQPKLRIYEETIRSTLGLRKQQRLPRTEALSVAACSSGHRDISLGF
ncbi:MAG TPA: TRAP transporter large permease subunit [Hyphomicrobiaceae bacterium]|nr:TRAP transporter large permease subunit [Hyphomicrobiaceae bacterium]